MLSDKFKYLENSTIFFWTVCVEIYRTLTSINRMWKLTKSVIIIWTNSLRTGSKLYPIQHLYIKRDTWLDENQKAKVLKVVANSQGSVVLSSEAAAHKSLISDRNPNYKGEGYVELIKYLYFAYQAATGFWGCQYVGYL